MKEPGMGGEEEKKHVCKTFVYILGHQDNVKQ